VTNFSYVCHAYPAMCICGGVVSNHAPSSDGCAPRINRTGDVRAVNHQMWLLTIIAAVLYGFILRDIAREVRGE